MGDARPVKIFRYDPKTREASRYKVVDEQQLMLNAVTKESRKA